MSRSRHNTMTLMLTAGLIAAGAGCGGHGNATSATNSDASSGAGGDSSGFGGGFLSTSGAGGSNSGSNSGGPGAGSGGDCNPQLVGVLRDFKGYPGGHPDFEHFYGNGQKGIVKFDLGPDKKPVYAPDGPTPNTTGKAEFDQWYRDVPGVNKNIPYTIMLTPDSNGVATFDSQAFFPIDNEGWGNEGFNHNFSFTYELHMVFQYSGGEIFGFTGDDDLWVFVNNRLAIDLGGLHPAQSDTLNLDEKATELGLEKGKEYPIDFFQAERHSTESHFKVQSSLAFTNCDPIIAN